MENIISEIKSRIIKDKWSSYLILSDIEYKEKITIDILENIRVDNIFIEKTENISFVLINSKMSFDSCNKVKEIKYPKCVIGQEKGIMVFIRNNEYQLNLSRKTALKEVWSELIEEDIILTYIDGEYNGKYLECVYGEYEGCALLIDELFINKNDYMIIHAKKNIIADYLDL